MAKKKINWGIIGLGNIARTFAHDLQLVNEAIIGGVASRNEEKAKAFACEFDASTYYGSYKALAADRAIDVVYVATPHPCISKSACCVCSMANMCFAKSHWA